jgi:predicted RNA-binding protein (TIGR00451 family)
VANYQFGSHVGEALFDGKVRIVCSKRTGRIRHILKGKQLLATLRPTDGYLALTVTGAQLVLDKIDDPPNVVSVQSDVGEFIKSGGDVFSKHVVSAPDLRPAEEAIVIDDEGNLLGVGTACISGKDMKYFKRGVAVRIRRGIGGKKFSSDVSMQEI